MKLELASYPISVNTLYRCVPGKGLLLSQRGREWFTDMQHEMILSKQKPESMLEKPLGMELHLYPPDHRVRDIDNPLKAICDLLTKSGCIKDDSQIKSLTAKLHDKGDWSGFKLRLWEL